MKKLFVTVALILVAAPVAFGENAPGFLVGEQTTGMTKQCFYDWAGGIYTMTVSAVDICPVTIEVPEDALF